jgi:predicted RNA-binding Zn-ribbon protein involved in translation (DUF1610 family)
MNSDLLVGIGEGMIFDSSLSESLDRSFSPEEYKGHIIHNLESLLRQRFPNSPGKQKIHPHTDRVTFSCPYCGDSMESDHKKRGNIILKGKFAGFYKCFNCGIFKPVSAFLKDYKIDAELELVNYLSSTKLDFKKSSYGSYDISVLINAQSIEDHAIEREELKKRFDFVEVSGTPILSWLRGRLQFEEERFLYNYNKNFLVILNLTKEGRIIGYQRRNFDKRLEKYNTYNLRKIYGEMGDLREIPDSIEAISQIYGISQLDFSRKITLFEGPLDSFLFPNSVANAGASKGFPIDIPIRYFYDWDKKGIEKSVEKIQEGNEVFLWTKLRNDLDFPERKKWDLNELAIWLKANGKPRPAYDFYFSADPLDILDI